MNIPFSNSEKTEHSYENIKTECPHCGTVGIYNKATDLIKTQNNNYKATCFSCNKEFQIIPVVESKWRFFLLDYYKLLKEKKYMSCILNLTIAFECYFFSCFKQYLFLKPANQGNIDGDFIYKMYNEFYYKIKDFSYRKLRNIFLNLIMNDYNKMTTEKIQQFVDEILKLKNDPLDKTIKSIQNKDLSKILLELKKFDINTQRNNIIHKTTYRPKLDEVEHYHKKSTRILYKLANEFKIEWKSY